MEDQMEAMVAVEVTYTCVETITIGLSCTCVTNAMFLLGTEETAENLVALVQMDKTVILTYLVGLWSTMLRLVSISVMSWKTDRW
jgi:hypothetical protein